MNVIKKLKLCSIFILLCFIPYLAYAQTITVRGKVTDNSREPIVGVSVIVSNNRGNGTLTDIDGNYTITTEPNNSLSFTYLGYTAQTIPINNRTTINVVMESTINELDEVVIVAYGQQTKASITSAISSVNTEELLKSPTISLGNALAGRLPGYSAIQYSGLPGWDDPTVYIRGIRTLSSGQSSPLILVDGVERPFTQLDPNEVADISILKDAGATAVFGVRGANGVILVTTKRGEVGKARISASGSFGIQQPMKIVNFANSYTYATTFNKAQLSDGVAEERLKYSPAAIEHWRLMDQPILYPSTDWMSYILEPQAFQNQFNINVNGGTETTKYFISIGKLFQDGIFRTFDTDPRSNFKYNRYNYRANLDIDFTKTTTLSLTLGGRIEDRNSTGDSNEDRGSGREAFIFRYLVESTPMSGAGIIDGKNVMENPSLVGASRRNGLWGHYGRGFRNEVSNILNFDMKLNQKLDAITQGLSWQAEGSYNQTFVQEKSRLNSTGSGLTIMSQYRPVPELDDAGNIIGVNYEKLTEQGNLGYSESFSFSRNWEFKTSLNYKRRFGSHNVSALLLYNQTKRFYPSSNSDIPTGYIGVVSRITYDYKFKYLLDLSMGINGSESFAPGKRYGVFPAGSVGWLLTEESFMKNQHFLDYLKLRFSIGMGGSDRGAGRFMYMPPSYVHGVPSNIGASSGGYGFGTNRNVWQPNVRESSMGNPNVSWDKSRKLNLGLDFKVLNNRLSFTGDVFKDHTWDILLSPSASIPAIFAFPSVPQINYGIVDNKGYEMQITWADKIGDFSYSISPNMSFSRNKIIEQMEIPQNYDYQYRTGKKQGQPFGYEFFEFYDPGKTEQRYRDKYGVEFPYQVNGLQAGDCTYVDLNGDGLINDQDQWAIGYTQLPEYIFGLNMSFKYKRFELSMLWIGNTHTNRDLSGAYRPAFGSQDDSALLQWVAENSWTPENPNAKFPRISFAHKDWNARASSVYLVNAQYARLKNFALYYNINTAGFLKFISNARIYITGNNLLTFSQYKANDPETTGAGYGEFFKYPPTRVYNIGLSVTF